MSKKSKFNRLTTFLSSKKGRLFFHITYSVGASIVILGALAKIIHMPMGNTLLVIGMLVEALVFLLSAFDVDQVDFEESSDSAIDLYSPEQRVYTGSAFSAANYDGVNPGQTGYSAEDVSRGSGGGYTASTVAGGGGAIIGGGTIFVGGGNNTGGGAGTTIPTDNSSGHGNATYNMSEATAGSMPNAFGSQLNISEEYLEEIAETTQKMASFSKVMSALNNMSEKIMSGCEQINEGAGEFGGLSNNMSKLNENITRINSVYEAQLGSIEVQMNSLQYINQSLERIKSLYGNTVLDSDLFRIENEKMARQIQELNRIYARLLQAMNAGANYNPNPSYNSPNPGQGYGGAPHNNPGQGGTYYSTPGQGDPYNNNPQY